MSLCLVAAGAISGYTALADEGLPEVKRSQQAPTMARFYSLDASGESQREAVSAQVLGAANVTEPKPAAQRSAARVKSGKSRNRKITILVGRSSPVRDTQAEWQCERAGFYYTRDGRCVAPAWKRVSRITRP